MSIEDQFAAAVQVIRSLPKNGTFEPTDEMKLKFYAYFKQATEGPNQTKKPAFYDIVNRYKWDVWKKLGDMDKHTAMKLYVDELKTVIETLSMSKQVGEFLDILAPFYEFLPENENNNNNNLKTSLKQNGKAGNEKASVLDHHEEDENDVPTSLHVYDSEGDNYYDTMEAVVSSTGMDSTKMKFASPQSSRSPQVKVFTTSYASQPTNTTGQALQQSNLEHQALSFNEQLCVTILQLQSNVEQLHRRVTQVEVNDKQQHNNSRPSLPSGRWSPFHELSYSTTACLIAWPLVAFFVMNYLRHPRK